MNDIRRTILWVIFGFSMVLLWDQWQIHNGNKPTFFAPPPQNAAAPAETKPGPDANGGVPAASAASTQAQVPNQANNAAPRVRTTVKSDVLSLVIDSEGASIAQADLLAYKDHIKQDSTMRLLDDARGQEYLAQSGLILSDAQAAAPTHRTPMRLVSKDTELTPGQDKLEVVFESDPVGGMVLVKKYTLERGQYLVHSAFEVINKGNASVQPQLYVQLVRNGNKPAGESAFYSTFTGPAVYTGQKKYQKVEFADIQKGKAEYEKQSSDGYVAMVQHYFASAWLLDNDVQRDIYARKIDENLYSVGMIRQLPAIEPGRSLQTQARLYVGPQQEKKLEAIYPGLELVKDYGWLTILAKPLFWLLDQLHGLLHNWGWSIVALVVLIKAAFYWLNAQAYRSMAKMKAINPRVMELRERMKDNPQQMQMEMMKLYREEKVNPMGGCLPIAIQIPVFIALYWVLLSTVEMRDAAWLYIGDLAQPDMLFGVIPGIGLPLGPLPILMTASSLLQTWLNPTPPDPMQARLMWIMPLAFSFMFFYFPSGLVLYWFTNNLLSIAQQWMINRQLGVNK
jgi:YidC/Oxa1 family membrane protein insertase